MASKVKSTEGGEDRALAFLEAKIVYFQLSDEVAKYSAVLQNFPRGPNGLVSDATRLSPEYRRAKANFDLAFSKARDFNSSFTKKFKKEWGERSNRKRVSSLSDDELLVELEMNGSGDLEWIKGPGVDKDGHNLAWWKSKVAKWKSQYDRPTVFIQVLCWDRTGASTRDWPQFEPTELKEAKAWAKDFIERTGGSCQVDGRVTIPYQGSVTIPLGEWKSSASNGYYVWTVDAKSQVPVARRGPFADYDEAITIAKQAGRSGSTYDEVVTFGGDPEAPDFSIEKAFKGWSGEVHYMTDLPRIGGRLREYR